MRYTGPKNRLSRREGVDLFGKGNRLRRLNVPPGMHGQKGTRKMSEYGRQLREKQKVKRMYGLMERQLRKYIGQALKTLGNTTNVLFALLERRLDNVVFRLGFAPTRPAARQIVSHRHVLVNGKKVNIPSYQVAIGETISLSTSGMKNPQVRETFAEKSAIIPKWLEKKAAVGRIAGLPGRDEIESDINEQLIVEYYSR